MKTYEFILNFPVCDVCNKPVKYISWHSDINFDYKVFKVKCHGKIQKSILTPQMMEYDVIFGKAFVNEKLT